MLINVFSHGQHSEKVESMTQASWEWTCPRNGHYCLGYTIGVLKRSNRHVKEKPQNIVQICKLPINKMQIFRLEQPSLLQILSELVHGEMSPAQGSNFHSSQLALKKENSLFRSQQLLS